MSSVEDRVAGLANSLLNISDRSALDSDVGDLGVNSVDAIAFLKAVNSEFGTNISADQAAGFKTLRALINHLS